MPINPVVLQWLRSAYPTLRIKQSWLEECCDYLEAHFEGLGTQQFIKKVEEQILLSSLADTCESGPLPTHSLSDTPVSYIGSGKNSVLVQVEAIFDAGQPALAIKEIHEQRKEEARIQQRGGNADRARIIDNVEDAEDSKGPPKFPRSMLTLQLSDGFTMIKGIEYKRIPELSLEETALGSKILLKNVKALRGILLLEPGNVIIKGQSIQELVEQADEILEQQIRERLNLPEEDFEQPPLQPVAVPPNAAPPPQLRQQNRPEPVPFDQDEEDALFAEVDFDIDQIPDVKISETKADDTFDDFDFDPAQLEEIDAIEKAAIASGSSRSLKRDNESQSLGQCKNSAAPKSGTSQQQDKVAQKKKAPVIEISSSQ